MKTATKRLLAGFSAAIMSVSAIGTANASELYDDDYAYVDDYALDEDFEVSETEAKNPSITCTISGDTLTVNGTGALNNTDILTNLRRTDVTNVKHIIIGSGITEIGSSVFLKYEFDSATLSIPSSVKAIGSRAFFGANLSEISFSEGLESIGTSAFSVCGGLTSVTIPASVTKIGGGVFTRCHSLTEINVASGNQNYTSLNGVLFNKEITDMQVYPRGKTDATYTIPSGVYAVDHVDLSSNKYLTSIYSNSFYFSSVDGILYSKDKTKLVSCPCGKKVTSFTIPSTVKTVGQYAFYHNLYLENVTIPSSVTTIENGAFSECSLMSLNIPDSVTTIGADAFSANFELSSVKLPKNLTEISYGLFSGCEALENITMPSKVASISSDAFSNCLSLESITIPDSVTTIYDYAFSQCSSLSDIKLPSSLTEIGSYAFSDCNALTKVTIPAKVTDMGACMFSCCENLEEVVLSDGITSIGTDAFTEAFALKKVTIPNSVTRIEKGAFYYCQSLTDVVLPEKLTFIGRSAFAGCDSLKTIKIPQSVETISTEAFIDSNNLAEVYLPDFYKGNLNKYVGEYAFPDTTEIKYYNTGSTVVDPTKPVVTAEPAYGGANVTWEPVKGAVNYRVYSFVPGGKIRQFGSDTNGTSMTVKGLKGGEKTGIIVLAQFANKKWSTYTEDDIAYVVPLDAVKPFLCVNPKGNGNYYLIWSSVPTSVRYKVMAREKGTNNWELIGATRSRCRITVELDPNKQYEFLVRGLNAKNKYTPMDADDIVSG